MSVTSNLSTALWRKSSYSGNEQGDACVEVCDDFPGTVPVRDSKNTDGPVLTLTAQAWVPFTSALKGDSL